MLNVISGGSGGAAVRSAVGPVAAPTSGQFGDATSISIPAGDWDISMMCYIENNGATMTNWQIGISATSGNATTGLVSGDNRAIRAPITGLGNEDTLSIPSFRVSLAATTTYYAKVVIGYSVATPNVYARISARQAVR